MSEYQISFNPIFNLRAYLGSHEFRSTTERARSGTEPHLLLAKTVVGDFDVTLHSQQNVIEFQVTGRGHFSKVTIEGFDLGHTGR